MRDVPVWLIVAMFVGPPAAGYALLLTLFWLERKLEHRRHGGLIDLTYVSRSVDRSTSRPRLYDQEADVDAAIALSEELRDIAREARG